jgi:hypothetical protein
MIRRILHAELSDVRTLAAEAKRCARHAVHHALYLHVEILNGCIMFGPGPRGWAGAGFIVDQDPDAEVWPDGARLLTIGRVTLAAWGRARKDGAA